jgi:hypothetical protein
MDRLFFAKVFVIGKEMLESLVSGWFGFVAARNI